MSDAGKMSEKEQMNKVKPDVEQEKDNELSPRLGERQGEMSDAGKMSEKDEMNKVKPDVEQEKDNEPKPSTPAENCVTANAQDENQRKYLEAMFALNRANICMGMWNVYNSGPWNGKP